MAGQLTGTSNGENKIMMIFNSKKRVPLVDDGSVVFSNRVTAPQDRARLRAQEAANRRRQQHAYLMAQENARRQEHAAAVQAKRNEAMLQRSLNQNAKTRALAGARHSLGNVPVFGRAHPLMGFVDAIPDCTMDADYRQDQVVPAQEFNNALAAKDLAYTKFRDYPLVLDAPSGDFGGILTNEAGSADFSERIVNDVKQDFGSSPKFKRW